MALKAKQNVTGIRLPKVVGSEANRGNFRKKSLPYPSRLNLLFKAGSARKLHESSFKVLRPADPPNEGELWI